MMTALGWGRLYGISAEQIGADHRIISDLILQLDDAVETGQSHDVVTNIVAALIEFTHHHLLREQSLETESRPDSSFSHARLHVDMINRLNDVRTSGITVSTLAHDIEWIKMTIELQSQDCGMPPDLSDFSSLGNSMTAGADHGA
jgi:hemerythrin